MSVTYTKEVKEEAKARGHALATLDVAGLSMQGPVTVEEQRELVKFYMDFTEKRNKRIASQPPLPPPPPPAAPPGDAS